jgi:hypothetical protein
MGEALGVLRRLVDDLVGQLRIGPDDHAEHPLDVREAEVREPTGLLLLLPQRFHQELVGLDRVPVPLAPFRNRVGLPAQHLQVLAVGLDLLREVLLAHHGAEVGEVVNLLNDVVELLSGGGLGGDLLEVEDVLWLVLLLLWLLKLLLHIYPLLKVNLNYTLQI